MKQPIILSAVLFIIAMKFTHGLTANFTVGITVASIVPVFQLGIAWVLAECHKLPADTDSEMQRN